MKLTDILKEDYDDRVKAAADRVVSHLNGIGGQAEIKKALAAIAGPDAMRIPDYNGSASARNEFVRDVIAVAAPRLKPAPRPLAGAALAASLKPKLHVIWNKAEDAVGQSMPDGDPMAYLGGWMRRHDVSINDLDRAAKANGYKSFYDYVADCWEDLSRDALHDANSGHYGEDYSHEWFARPNPWR